MVKEKLCLQCGKKLKDKSQDFCNKECEKAWKRTLRKTR